MKTAICLLAFICSIGWGSDLYAKRSPPKEIPPVLHEGVRYQVIHFKYKNGHQNGGYVEAVTENDGKKKWGILLYLVEYDPHLERDVQDCFITSLRLDKKNSRLIATNEAGDLYYVDLTTQRVMHVIPPRRR